MHFITLVWEKDETSEYREIKNTALMNSRADRTHQNNPKTAYITLMVASNLDNNQKKPKTNEG